MSNEDEQSSNSSDESEPAPAGESTGSESEPPPAGEGPEPEPSPTSDSPDAQGNTNLEPPDAVSDSPAETDGSHSSSSGNEESSSSNSSSESSSSSSDNSSTGQTCQPPPSEDDVAKAVTSALQMREVPVGDDGVKVTLSTAGLYQVMVRLADNFMPLPQVPADTSNLPPGSVRGAMYLLQGAVQLMGDEVTVVTLRVVSLETSQILEAGKGVANGASGVDGIQPATEDAIANLPSLGAR